MGNEENRYFCKTKFMNDYSFMFKDEFKLLQGDNSNKT